MERINRQKNILSIPLILVFITLAFICFFGLFYIYPSYRSFSQTRQAILEQSAKIADKTVLYPIFVKSKILDQIQFKYLLPFPERVQIHPSEFAKLSRKISDTAQGNHMALSGSDFDINSLKDLSLPLSVVIKLKGNLFDFRRFLVDIISSGYFNSIEHFSILANEGKIKEFTLKLNIRIKTQP